MDAEQPRDDCPECAQLRQGIVRRRWSLSNRSPSSRRRWKKNDAAANDRRRRSRKDDRCRAEAAGSQVGQATWSACPSQRAARIDETYDVPLPQQCPALRRVEHVSETHVAVQYQTEIPRTVIYRRFDVHVGTCDDCGHTVAGRHALQTVDGPRRGGQSTRAAGACVAGDLSIKSWACRTARA